MKIAVALILATSILVWAGCSNQSSESTAASDGQEYSGAGKQMAMEDDTTCEKILKSSDIMEANDWLTRYPKSRYSSNAIDPDDPNGTPLGPVVSRLSEAGAQRIVIHYGVLGNAQVLIGVIAVLPADAAARQKLFAIGAELSQIDGSRAPKDYGQKYLYFDLE